MAKTVIIYDQWGQEDLTFGVTELDCEGLNNLYINAFDTNDEDTKRLNEIIDQTNFSTDFPCQAVKDGATVVVIGFIP
jgi:hypothetical protein